MDITYLIGNGFDLGIGLKTSFEHFLEYYLTVKSDDVEITDFKDTIREDTIKLWADLEFHFGKYIENFDDNYVENYIKVYEDILLNLNKYLKKENDRIIDDIEDDNRNKIITDIMLFDRRSAGLREAIFDDIFKNTGYFRDDRNATYNFITFNYTTTLDRILNDISKRTNNILYTSQDKKALRKINKIIHIHGKLDSNAMIFGVNDESQLKYPGNIPANVKRRIIKPVKNSLLGHKTDIQCQEFIKNSGLICIYGMSIGVTDTFWWEEIGKWLISSQDHRLIYFVYDKDVDHKSVYGMDNILDAEEKYRNRFMEIAKIPNSHRGIAEKRIHVIINSNFMQMNLVKKEKEDENECKSEVTV